MFNPSLSNLAPAGFDFVTDLLLDQRDPQLGYMWEVRVESSDAPRDYEKSIQLFARDCQIPQRSVEEMNRYYVGEFVSDPGHSNEPRQFRMNLWDDKRLVGYRYFHDWMNIISDPVYGKQVSKERLLRTVSVKLKDRTDVFLGIEIKLKRSYLFNIGDVNLSYDESMPFIFNVGISYEEMIINDTPYEMGGSSPQSGGGILAALRDKVGGVL